ncbi:MAG: inositol-3-phosphate synthase [Nitrospirota bacterium]
MEKVGVLFIGALGYIATTVMAGALALKRGAGSRAGMVTDLNHFAGLDLVEPGEIVFGGWDIREGSPRASAAAFLKNNQLVAREIIDAIDDELDSVLPNLFRGTARNCGRAIAGLSHPGAVDNECAGLREQVDKLRSDIQRFRENNRLDTVIVINLASTEPPLVLHDAHHDLDELECSLDENRADLVRASTLYAYAAVAEDCPYLNFTPSNGALIPAIIRMAEREGVPVMGNDGKTGETLVKSALAPLFLCRNLEILSWEGFNILGNMDGKVLDDPENKESKIRTKDRLLGKILGYTPHSSVHINYVPSLDDQKTAWNFIHFKGFLDVKMSLQFIWQGYDSILAAPLVLDLVRLAELARRHGEPGLMPQLASFFKAPLGASRHQLCDQFQMLIDYVNRIKRSKKALANRHLVRGEIV